jgi:hypothetical protein
MVLFSLNFAEWLLLDEAKSKTFVAKPHKPKPTPAVHHDLDSWLQHVDNLKKELETLKGKLKDKSDKPEEPKEKVPFKPGQPKKPEDEDEAEEKEDDKPDDDKPDDDKPDDAADKEDFTDKPEDRVLHPVAADRLDFGHRPVPEHPVSGDRSSRREPNSKTPPDRLERRPGSVHGD